MNKEAGFMYSPYVPTSRTQSVKLGLIHLLDTDVGDDATWVPIGHVDMVNDIPELDWGSTWSDKFIRIWKDRDLSKESIEKIKCYTDYMKL